MKIRSCLPLLLLVSTSVYSRPRSITVIFEEPMMLFQSLQFREQTTRAWLAGCTWPDILQGNGWFPATFYSNTQPTSPNPNTVTYAFAKRKPLAAFCGAVTDNVANYISFEYFIADTGRDVYGGIPFTLGTSDQASAVVECRYSLAENKDQKDFFCDTASLKSDGDLTINVTLIKE